MLTTREQGLGASKSL